MSPHLSILIISYNTRELTLACLHSVYGQTRGVPFEVIVLDNASADGSADAVAAEFPEVKLIPRGDNTGFGRGNNLAAEHASGRYLLLLNPDTLLNDNSIGTLVRFAELRPDAGAWGGVTVRADGSVERGCMWSGYGLRSALLQAVGLGRFLTSGISSALDRPAEVQTLGGAFMMVEADLWRRLGGFDESFFMYSEEVDLCRRIAQLGRPILMTPDARVIHLAGGSIGVHSRRRIAQMRGRMHFARKHYSRTTVVLHGAVVWFHAATRVFGTAVAWPLIGWRRASEMRRTWLPLMLHPSQWWGGYGREFSPQATAASPPPVS